MSALGDAVEGLAIPVAELGIALAKKALTPADAADELISLAVKTGVALEDLHGSLERAAKARQRLAFDAAKLAELGDPGEAP